MHKLAVSLVVPAYNEELQIAGCLAEAIRHSEGRFKQIIVVDNGSTDKTASIARSFPGVEVVTERTRGLTHARQRGLLAASSEIIAYIDADTRLPAKWLDTVEACFASRVDVVSISGPARYFDATRWESWILAMGWWLTAPIAYRLVGYMLYGGHFAVRKSALESIGGFDTSIRFYGEDTDLARRLSRLGKTLFKMNFTINASARRFKREGIARTLLLYALNFLWPVLFARPFTHLHQDVRM